MEVSSKPGVRADESVNNCCLLKAADDKQLISGCFLGRDSRIFRFVGQQSTLFAQVVGIGIFGERTTGRLKVSLYHRSPSRKVKATVARSRMVRGPSRTGIWSEPDR